MASPLVSLLGSSLLQKEALPPGTPEFMVVDKATHEWSANCDRCEKTIVGPRFKCTENDNYDLCGGCIAFASECHPGHTFDEVPIPDKPTPLPKTTVETEKVLNGKVVGLYFSAHWCGPCRYFTPQLAEFYKKMQASGKAFEIVFVSSDQDENAFNNYYDEMPWCALPYSARDLKESLSTKYKVQGIPTLVLVDEKGETINANARGKVMQDPEGLHFPYVPKTFREMLGNHFINRDGDTFGDTAIKGKHLGLYFSASWCGPCQNFTPRLVEAYTAAKANGHDFEILFVSGDRQQSDFDEYFKKMPWLALPFEAAREVYEDLGELYDVQGIPHLVILGPNRGPSRPTINKDAVSVVGSDLSAESFPWPPKSVTDLSEGLSSNGFSINDKPAIIVYCETMTETEQSEVETSLKTLSTEINKGMVCTGDVCTLTDEPSIIFFTNKSEGGIGERIHEFVGEGAEKLGPHAVLLDVPSSAGYVHKGSIDEGSLRQLLQQFQAKTLAMKSLGH